MSYAHFNVNDHTKATSYNHTYKYNSNKRAYKYSHTPRHMKRKFNVEMGRPPFGTRFGIRRWTSKRYLAL